MNLSIKGNELKITVTSSGRDLSTKEIIAIHQLATGNFEALFVDTAEPEAEAAPAEKAAMKVEVIEPEDDKPAWIDKGEWVQAEIDCPFCGHTDKASTKWGNSFTKCSQCKEPLFNKYATGTPGEKNSWGCVYLCNERMTFKHKEDPYAEIFPNDSNEEE